MELLASLDRLARVICQAEIGFALVDVNSPHVLVFSSTPVDVLIFQLVIVTTLAQWVVGSLTIIVEVKVSKRVKSDVPDIGCLNLVLPAEFSFLIEEVVVFLLGGETFNDR